MNRHRVISRCVVGLGLAIAFTAAAVPAYAIADGIQRAQADRPDRVHIGQPRMPSEAERAKDVPNSVLRPKGVHLGSGQAAEPVPVEAPSSVRKEPRRLEP